MDRGGWENGNLWHEVAKLLPVAIWKIKNVLNELEKFGKIISRQNYESQVVVSG